MLWSTSRPDFEYAAPMQSPRRDFTVTTIYERQLLVVGGQDDKGRVLDSWEVFDAESKTFTARGTLPYSLMDHAAVFREGYPDNSVIIVGGWDGAKASDSIFIMEPHTWRVTEGPKLRFPRRRPAIIELCEGILIAGGADCECGCEFYNPETGKLDYWDGPVGTLKGAAFLPGPKGTLLLTGGLDSSGRVSDRTFIIDIHSKTCRPGPPLQTARYGHYAMGVNWPLPLLLGGIGPNGKPLSTTEYYDEAKGAFANGPSLLWPITEISADVYFAVPPPETSMSHDLWGLILIGGERGKPSARTQAMYPAKSPVFHTGPTLQKARCGAQVGWLHVGFDDICVVLGGATRDAPATATVEYINTRRYLARRNRLINVWLRTWDSLKTWLRLPDW